MGIFGWSYPAGCSGPPEEPEYCEVCGNHYDSCICPECRVCKNQGDPHCYIYHKLKRTEEQKFSIESAIRYWELVMFKEVQSQLWLNKEEELWNLK